MARETLIFGLALLTIGSARVCRPILQLRMDCGSPDTCDQCYPNSCYGQSEGCCAPRPQEIRCRFNGNGCSCQLVDDCDRDCCDDCCCDCSGGGCSGGGCSGCGCSDSGCSCQCVDDCDCSCSPCSDDCGRECSCSEDSDSCGWDPNCRPTRFQPMYGCNPPRSFYLSCLNRRYMLLNSKNQCV